MAFNSTMYCDYDSCDTQIHKECERYISKILKAKQRCTVDCRYKILLSSANSKDYFNNCFVLEYRSVKSYLLEKEPYAPRNRTN